MGKIFNLKDIENELYDLICPTDEEKEDIEKYYPEPEYTTAKEVKENNDIWDMYNKK